MKIREHLELNPLALIFGVCFHKPCRFYQRFFDMADFQARLQALSEEYTKLQQGMLAANLSAERLCMLTLA